MKNYKVDKNNSPIVMNCSQCFIDGKDVDYEIALFVYGGQSLCKECLATKILQESYVRSVIRNWTKC